MLDNIRGNINPRRNPRSVEENDFFGIPSYFKSSALCFHAENFSQTKNC
uniref:Ycf2 n=1 Tax=Pinus squamata TaxID=196513 RepID=A0A346PZJ7_9CONI|nr:ycf2 [Pinus squamata]AXR86173.1 ycf2 [Pinus squamata]